jgi:hypothetical protein
MSQAERRRLRWLARERAADGETARANASVTGR